jgi:hypothetical protein
MLLGRSVMPSCLHHRETKLYCYITLSSSQFVHSQRQRPRTIMRDIDSCSWDNLAFLRTPSNQTDSLIETNAVCAYLANNNTRRKEVLHTLHPRTLILMPFGPNLNLWESIAVTALRTRPQRLMRQLAFQGRTLPHRISLYTRKRIKNFTTK